MKADDSGAQAPGLDDPEPVGPTHGVAAVAPTLRPGSRRDETKEEHPAYATIGASRISATPGTYLYGSDFRHGHYITITIQKSSLTRTLSKDWIHGHGLEYIQVSLSEAQWASFVSTLNYGTGVACTLERLQGERIPEIARTQDRREQFRGELRAAVDEAMQEIKKLRAHIENGGMSKRAKEDALKHVQQVTQKLTDSVPWVAKSFDEHADRTVERAKIEIEAHMSATVQRAGLRALAATHATEPADVVPLQIEGAFDAAPPVEIGQAPEGVDDGEKR